ncbi:MAG: polysaccharide ABC transporter ATP-binding protein [Candidatus Saccharimonadales bacterium]
MDKEVAISVNHISKSFKLPHEQHSGLKQLLINRIKGKKGYEDQHVLKDLNFEIKKGEFFGIVGRNGSGKSTLLKTLAGIYSPDQGYVKTNGSLTPFIELGVGFNPELTGRENVFLNGALLGFSRSEMEAMYDEIVEFAELGRFMDQKLKNYSSGMQVRLAFSVAIRSESEILVLDEVLAVGDAAFQQKCNEYFEKVKQEQRTIILVTHSMDAVKRFCNRALLLENGVIKTIGSPQDVADQYTVDNIPVSVKKSVLGHNANQLDSGSIESFNASINNDEYYRSDKIKISVEYTLKDRFEVMLGVSIIKDGRSVAELNSMDSELGNKPGVKYKASLEVTLENFNPNLYSVDVVIFNKQNKSILDRRIKVREFVVKGNDQTRGGVIYIQGPWIQ